MTENTVSTVRRMKIMTESEYAAMSFKEKTTFKRGTLTTYITNREQIPKRIEFLKHILPFRLK